MRSRLLLGVLAYGGALALLLIAVAVGNLDQHWRWWLLAALVLQFGTLWLRDRLFPRETDQRRPGELRPPQSTDLPPAMWQRPWAVALAGFALVSVPMLVLLRATEFRAEFDIITLAAVVGVWGVFIATAGLLLANDPGPHTDRMFEWWLPNAALILLAFASSKLVPEIVILIARREIDPPDIRVMLIIPVAALVWRSYRARRNRGTARG